ncbi:MAG: hypothetical protein DRP57_00225 [Spirochaetes bacterium]|nr:MAG: hypothetical protein DRP57_00225 [Spirochaetota bacterium]
MIVKRILLLIILFSLIPISFLFSWRILYAEQYYKLYHLHFYQYPDDSMENIFYLEQALKSDFANPLYALAKISDKSQWERYRYLFKMHLNLKLIEQYLTLGSKYDKMNAYFYNYPWKYANLDSLKKAEKAYLVALDYWKEVLEWADKAWDMRYINLPEVQNWEDENYRIETGLLDYNDIIGEHLARLERVREDFKKMDKNTY